MNWRSAMVFVGANLFARLFFGRTSSPLQSSRKTLRTWLAGLLLALPGLPAHAFDFSFALFGDTPYTDKERALLPGMLEAMGRDGNEFSVHDGDIKNGASNCGDGVYTDILGAFQASPIPLVYLPGDNEWTDCHRLLDGLHDPVERLHHLRKFFFTDSQSLGKKRFTLERQGDVDKNFQEYRENVRWNRGRVLFIGLNIPGSNNNYGDGNQASAEFRARANANRAWLESSFALAHRERHTVIFVMMQANPDFAAYTARRENLGYRDFLDQLTDLVLAFPGRVVLVHGDTHIQRIDQPLRDPRSRSVIRRFLRVETYGSPYMGWTKVSVRNADTNPSLKFTLHPWPEPPLLPAPLRRQDR